MPNTRHGSMGGAAERWEMKAIKAGCVLLLVLCFAGCTPSNIRLAQAMLGVTDWVDGMAQCDATDAAVEARMDALPAPVESLQKALLDMSPGVRSATLTAVREYMHTQFPTMNPEFGNAQKLYIVFGVK